MLPHGQFQPGFVFDPVGDDIALLGADQLTP
jgi:hypothetical protein